MILNGKSNGPRPGLAEAKKATPVVTGPATTAPEYVDHVGDNVRIEVTGDVLTITVDLRQDFGASSSGKTSVVASTRGFAGITTHRGISIALNVNRKK